MGEAAAAGWADITSAAGDEAERRRSLVADPQRGSIIRAVEIRPSSGLFLRKVGTPQPGVECRFRDGGKLGIGVPRVLRAPPCYRIDFGSQFQ